MQRECPSAWLKSWRELWNLRVAARIIEQTERQGNGAGRGA